MRRKGKLNGKRRKPTAGFTRTDEEWRLITEAAKQAGLKPASYMRSIVIKQARSDLAA